MSDIDLQRNRQTDDPELGITANKSGALKRSVTLVRPERERDRQPLVKKSTTHYERTKAEIQEIEKEEPKRQIGCWDIFVNISTCCIPAQFLAARGKTDPLVQRAFREKFALCVVIFLLFLLAAMLLYGVSASLCPASSKTKRRILFSGIKTTQFTQAQELVFVNSEGYDFTQFSQLFKVTDNDRGTDLTFRFTPDPAACSVNGAPFQNPCMATRTCFDRNLLSRLQSKIFLAYEWPDISAGNFTVYNGHVLDLSLYLQISPPVFGPVFDNIVQKHLSGDSTLTITKTKLDPQLPSCLIETFKVGNLEKQTIGCFASFAITSTNLGLALLLTFVKFVLAVAFSWFLSARLDNLTRRYKVTNQLSTSNAPNKTFQAIFDLFPKSSKYGAKAQKTDASENPGVIILVTCYSEGDESIRGTLSSLAQTDYPDQNKMLFIVCDGLVKGSGNDKTTPEIVKDMVTINPAYENPVVCSYVAVADGSKRHNKAQVYPGYFQFQGRSIPTIVIVKTGTEDEKDAAKPGNRGKRDSQIMLMDAVRVSFFNEKMTSFQYDLFNKIKELTGMFLNDFEMILMVDADTRVDTEAVSRMVAAMQQDPLVMGLCGETKIANKTTSWVTRIQVFEYYISHHMGKAFEAMFGTVTCLPGCFSMYRTKAPKNGKWVPILCNPEVIEEYSVSRVETLHQKNLLFLGEDRFLTTLMIRTYPSRKLIFDEWKVLLSQRRRWINSTIHNLLELILVRELCGVFCFSMQCVIAMDLFGTAILPASLVLTFVVIINYFTNPLDGDILSLVLLLVILFLPAILVLLTSKKLIYAYWMIIYLLALPVWNFALPMYAYWNMDDFSWGQTRKVEGEKAGDDHGATHGTFDNQVPRKRWIDWTKKANKKSKTSTMNESSLVQ